MSMPASVRTPLPTAVRPSRSPRLPRSQNGQIALFAAILLPIILCVELVLPPGGQRHAISSPASGTMVSASTAAGTSNSTSAATVDPRLVLHPHSTSITGSLAGGLRVNGTLSPTIPGKNTLRLALRSVNGQPLRAGHVSVVVTMPGMSMPPIKTMLHAQGSAYAVTVRLPMFGRYHATVTIATPAHHHTGAMTLNLPLPLK